MYTLIIISSRTNEAYTHRYANPSNILRTACILSGAKYLNQYLIIVN